MSRARTPSATPHCAPSPFHSLDPLGPSGRDGGGRAAALAAGSLLRSPMGSLAAGEGMGPQGPPASLNPSCTPKGHKLFLHPSWVAKTRLCRATAPKARSREGLTLPSSTASAQGPAGCTGSPGHPRGLRAADPLQPQPPAPSDQPTGGRWDQPQGKSCSLGAPQTCAPGLAVQWESPGRG